VRAAAIAARIDAAHTLRSRSGLTRLKGIPLVLQGGFIFLHWWWVFVLAFPERLIVPSNQYRVFAEIGDDDYWVWRSLVVAILATIVIVPMPRVVRAMIGGIQAGWLAVIAVLFACVWPPVTGFGAYLVLFFFASIFVWLGWKWTGNGQR
jgi:hypothetical protein